MNCRFSFKHYTEMLMNAIEKGYDITGFDGYRRHGVTGGKIIILRHDIDYGRGLVKALQLGRREQALSIQATYFIRLHSPEYNPFEYECYRNIRQLKDMGHEIGLHFEAHDFHALTGQGELGIFQKEKGILEYIFDINIVSAAEHGENHRFSNKTFQSFFSRHAKESVGIINDAYAPEFIRDMKYLSDSDGSWREGCFCTHIDRFDRIQLLTHPEWWGH